MQYFYGQVQIFYSSACEKLNIMSAGYILYPDYPPINQLCTYTYTTKFE